MHDKTQQKNKKDYKTMKQKKIEDISLWVEGPQNLKELCKLAKSSNMTPMETYKTLVKKLGPLIN